MNEYFYQEFPEHLKLVEFKRPNLIILEREQDSALNFFGGKDWGNVSEDLSYIPKSKRANFILSLFMVVLTDQCLFTCFSDSYPIWRKQTGFPKFGWSGFGPHNENPLKLLWAPEREKEVDNTEVIEDMPNFVDFMIKTVKDFFNQNLSDVKYTDFFDAIINDSAFEFSEGEIVKSFKTVLQQKLA